MTSPEPAEVSKPATPRRDVLKEVWEDLQAIRREHEPRARGQELTTARRTNLRSRIAELLTAKLSREDLLMAARWVYTSDNIKADGARKTGDPIETMLRPKHCVVYVELAIKASSQGSTSVESSRPAGLTAAEIEREKGSAYLYNLTPGPGYGEYTEAAKVAMETGIYPL